jgi:hypothetical protein
MSVENKTAGFIGNSVKHIEGVNKEEGVGTRAGIIDQRLGERQHGIRWWSG